MNELILNGTAQATEPIASASTFLAAWAALPETLRMAIVGAVLLAGLVIFAYRFTRATI